MNVGRKSSERGVPYNQRFFFLLPSFAHNPRPKLIFRARVFSAPLFALSRTNIFALPSMPGLVNLPPISARDYLRHQIRPLPFLRRAKATTFGFRTRRNKIVSRAAWLPMEWADNRGTCWPCRPPDGPLQCPILQSIQRLPVHSRCHLY